MASSKRTTKLPAGKIRVSLKQLDQLILNLGPELYNALTLEGTPVLVPTHSGMELRVLKDGRLVAPTVIGSITRVRQVEDVVRQARQEAKADPIRNYLFAKGITERALYDKARSNLNQVQHLAHSEAQARKILGTYHPADPFEAAVTKFVLDCICPDMRRVLTEYMSGEEFKAKSFTAFHAVHSHFNATALNIFSFPLNLATTSIRKLVFPKRFSGWLGIKPDMIGAYKAELATISYWSDLEDVLKETTILQLYEDLQKRIITEAQGSDEDPIQLTMTIVPAYDTYGEYWKSRTAFKNDFAGLRTAKGCWEAAMMGFIAPLTMISGQRSNVSNNELTQEVLNVDLKEVTAEVLKTKVKKTHISLVHKTARSWGQPIEPDGKTPAKMLPVKVKPTTPAEVKIELSLSTAAKAEVDAIILKEQKEKKMTFLACAPMTQQVQGEVNTARFPSAVHKIVGNFLKSLPQSIQYQYWSRLSAIWQGDEPVTIKEDSDDDDEKVE